MKYIRTKDNEILELISDIPFYSERALADVYRCKNGREPLKEWVIATADTIEELCDEFVTKVIYPNPHGVKPHGYYMHASMLFEDTVKYYLDSIKRRGKTYDVYGCIWTDKGLIFVAKLNEKGELELL